jgi:protein-tyrosine phosphatase
MQINNILTKNSKLKTKNYKDYHCHLLPDLDDGAADMAEAVAMARILAESGFTEVCCTPHAIKGVYDSAPGKVRETVADLQRELDKADIDLTVTAGMEYYFDEFLLSRLRDPLRIVDTKLVLIESPIQANPEYLAESAYQVVLHGFTPLIAHPERCELFELPAIPKKGIMEWFKDRSSKLNGSNTKPDSPLLMDYLKSIGCLFQGNIGSFAGIYGQRVQKRAVQYLEGGRYHCLGSDTHSSRHLAGMLECGIREVKQRVGADRLQQLLGGLPVFASSEQKPPVRDVGWRLGAGC